MSVLGNIIWIVFGGALIALEYLLSGVAMCLTIVGIPFGLQAFKLAGLALFPFGSRTVVADGNRGCLSALLNLIWLLVGGIWIALTHLGLGLFFCITIIGIPFGLQHFKLMTLSLSLRPENRLTILPVNGSRIWYASCNLPGMYLFLDPTL